MCNSLISEVCFILIPGLNVSFSFNDFERFRFCKKLNRFRFLKENTFWRMKNIAFLRAKAFSLLVYDR